MKTKCFECRGIPDNESSPRSGYRRFVLDAPFVEPLPSRTAGKTASQVNHCLIGASELVSAEVAL